jgi:predicted metal-dependent hydrolase
MTAKVTYRLAPRLHFEFEEGLDMEVRLIRSRKRLRTVSARVDNGVLVVRAPALLSGERLDKIIMNFKDKLEKKKIKDELDKTQGLNDAFRRINEQYFNNSLKINSIEYVTGQNSKYGCCNYRTANIRISHKVGLMPRWVRDYVVLHEMAHLVEPNHSRAFWNIVSRYRLAERARGYLMAVGLYREENEQLDKAI